MLSSQLMLFLFHHLLFGCSNQNFWPCLSLTFELHGGFQINSTFFFFFFFLFFQTILASAFVKKDYDKATTIASRVLQVCKYFDTSLPFFGSSTFSLFSSFLNCLWFYTQLSVVLGLVLTVNLLVGLPFSSRLFTKDLKVLQLIGVGIPVLFSNFPQTTHTMFYHKCRVYIISELNCPFCWLVYCSNSTY